MGVDIYAAKQDEDGTWGPVLDFKHASPGSYVESGDWVANEHYIPGAAMSMSSGNWIELVEKVIGMPESQFLALPLEKARMEVMTALERQQDAYSAERLLQLANVISIGISRGAKRLAVAG